jgi:hypothetical protein
MSWEHERYTAFCEQCGRTGFCTHSSDDWGRSATRWEGFENVPPHLMAIARKRADPGDMRPLCRCGSTRVVLGPYIGRS